MLLCCCKSKKNLKKNVVSQQNHTGQCEFYVKVFQSPNAAESKNLKQQQQQIHDNIRLTRNVGPVIHLAEFISQQLRLRSNVV